MESFFSENIIYANDVKRRLNTIGALDKKLQTKKTEFDELKNKIKGLKKGTPASAENHLMDMLENIYKEMRAIQIEKYEYADTSMLMYECALRKACKNMEELKPEEPMLKESFQTKLIGGIDELEIEDDFKPIKPPKKNTKSNKNVKKKEEKPEPKLPPESMEYFPPDLPMGNEEDGTCP